VVADRVAQARLRAAARLAGTPWRTNGEVPGPELRRRFPPGPGTEPVLDRLVAGPSESARGVDRVVRLAWTIADLAGHDRPGPADLLQALGLRSSEGRWAA
jgi:magnesium chelatase family protein